MNRDEALKVAGVIRFADSSCKSCVRILVAYMQAEIPEFDWRELVNEAEGDPNFV